MHDVARPISTKGKMKSNRGVLGIAIASVIALMVVVVGIKVLQIVKMAKTSQPMPVTAVTSALVKEEDWAPVFSSVGSISPVQGAVVATEIGGVVSEIKCENGSAVRKGDVWMRLDASAGEELLQSAEAEF